MKARSGSFLHTLSAYGWLMLFAAFGLAFSWCLRSDIFSISVAISAPANISNFLFVWTTPLVILPWVLICVGLEHYMNEAAQTGTVWQRARKVITIEGIAGLVIVVVLGLLALAGYPPIW